MTGNYQDDDALTARLPTAAANSVSPNDEFTALRLTKRTLAGCRDQLTDPERLSAADTEMDALAARDKALTEGIAALQLAEGLPLIADFPASVPCLAALYHHQGCTELARSGEDLAQREGPPTFELGLPPAETEIDHG